MSKTFVLVCALGVCSCGKKPTADFGWTPSQPKVLTLVITPRTQKNDLNLGNMKISSEKNPTNTYDQPGNYIIDLTARNGEKSDSKTMTRFKLVFLEKKVP